MQERNKIYVIGGGPAGVMAAAQAAYNGHDVTLIEKNEKLLKKLFITGKGRCNVTNACDIEDFFQNIARNKSFCYSAIYTFTPDSAMALIEDNGTPLKVERGNRVFPQSDKSSDIMKALEKYLKRSGARILKYGGTFAVVYRPDRLIDLIDAMRKAGLEPKRMTYVHANESSEPSMVLIESKKGGKCGLKLTRPLLIYKNKDNKEYSDDMSYIMNEGSFPKEYKG